MTRAAAIGGTRPRSTWSCTCRSLRRASSPPLGPPTSRRYDAGACQRLQQFAKCIEEFLEQAAPERAIAPGVEVDPPRGRDVLLHALCEPAGDLGILDHHG